MGYNCNLILIDRMDQLPITSADPEAGIYIIAESDGHGIGFLWLCMLEFNDIKVYNSEEDGKEVYGVVDKRNAVRNLQSMKGTLNDIFTNNVLDDHLDVMSQGIQNSKGNYVVISFQGLMMDDGIEEFANGIRYIVKLIHDNELASCKQSTYEDSFFRYCEFSPIITKSTNTMLSTGIITSIFGMFQYKQKTNTYL